MVRWLPVSVLCILVVLSPAIARADMPCPDAHVFYYGWYGNPETDGQWRHWDHPTLPRQGAGTPHTPPEDIGANYYPGDGLCSSLNRDDVTRQMKQIKDAGIGVLAASWWGKDDISDQSLALLFEIAPEYSIQICFHIEPFPGRNAETTRAALVYLLDCYGDHPALRLPGKQQHEPLRVPAAGDGPQLRGELRSELLSGGLARVFGGRGGVEQGSLGGVDARQHALLGGLAGFAATAIDSTPWPTTLITSATGATMRLPAIRRTCVMPRRSRMGSTRR